MIAISDYTVNKSDNSANSKNNAINNGCTLNEKLSEEQLNNGVVPNGNNTPIMKRRTLNNQPLMKEKEGKS